MDTPRVVLCGVRSTQSPRRLCSSPNISTVFEDAWPTIAEKLGDEAMADLVIETDEGPDLIPAHPGLDTLDSELGNIDDARERYSRLERFLDDYIDPLGYDIVLIDLPGMTNNVAYNGLWAAGHVITPVEMGPFEAEQADALRRDLAKLVDSFAVDIELALVLPNKVDTRTNLAEEYLAAFQEEYPEAIASKYIPYSQDIRNAAQRGQTSHGDRIDEAATQDEKRALVEDILAELEAIDAGEHQKTISVWDGHLVAFVRALEENPDQLETVGHALQRHLDLDETAVDRSDVLRLALRLGFQQAAPDEYDAVREAARRQATEGL